MSGFMKPGIQAPWLDQSQQPPATFDESLDRYWDWVEQNCRVTVPVKRVKK